MDKTGQSSSHFNGNTKENNIDKTVLRADYQ